MTFLARASLKTLATWRQSGKASSSPCAVRRTSGPHMPKAVQFSWLLAYIHASTSHVLSQLPILSSSSALTRSWFAQWRVTALCDLLSVDALSDRFSIRSAGGGVVRFAVHLLCSHERICKADLAQAQWQSGQLVACACKTAQSFRQSL